MALRPSNHLGQPEIGHPDHPRSSSLELPYTDIPIFECFQQLPPCLIPLANHLNRRLLVILSTLLSFFLNLPLPDRQQKLLNAYDLKLVF